jgi:pimeloyl-ACP methyl ester carboxylesterase
MLCSRRRFVTAGASGVIALADLLRSRNACGQPAPQSDIQFADTPVLRLAYEAHGPADGFPIVLLHGFPDDVRAWDGVVPSLVRAGHRVVVPWLRGFGPTRFRDAAAPRTAEQAAIGQDVIDLIDAMRLPRVVLAGYDWGGRAAAVAAALHPERVRATVLIGGYTIQNTISPPPPAPPEAEYRAWYQWYFNTERGRAGLAANRRDLCRLLWRLWSPHWQFTDTEYDRTAASFDNPDFVDTVIHSYRHRNFNAPGEPRFADMEAQLAKRPPIQAPSVMLYGADDGVAPPSRTGSPAEQAAFSALLARRVIDGVGHFMPRERPDAVSSALLDVLAASR